MAEIDNRFGTSLAESGLIISPSIRRRFIASLLTKRFVILTGLSGSGKTRLAQALAAWLDQGSNAPSTQAPFIPGDIVAADRVNYHVDAVDSLSVLFSNPREDGRIVKVALPFALIDDWVNAIRSHGYTRHTPARTIREDVKEYTPFSPQLNSFETHLKAAAFHIIEQEPTISLESVSPSALTYAVIAVGADWHNSEPILGYPDALNPHRYVRTPVLDLLIRASENSNIPHFLILDEMNLSHVERYFADILSAIESGEPLHLYDSLNGVSVRDGVPSSLILASNVFIIGTVNVDETTYLFSPKVLDRANSIEFRVEPTAMAQFMENTGPVSIQRLKGQGRQFATQFLKYAKETPPHLNQGQRTVARSELGGLFDLMTPFGLEFGFRSAYEIDRFIRVFLQMVPDESVYAALDAQIYQKVLPRLNGSRATLDPVLAELENFCKRLRSDDEESRYPLSLRKVQRMRTLLRQNGFTSFAEA